MSRKEGTPQALACVVGIALFLFHGSQALGQLPASPADPDQIAVEFDDSLAAPHINARFRPRKGWIGADGGQSVVLGNNRTLWLYGDTWVGEVKDGRRSHARIVHNSVGIQCGPDVACDFIVRETGDQKPVDFLTPVDGRGWLWFQAGIVVKDRLYLFLSQFERSDNPDRPEHRQIAQWMAVIDNPSADPLDWNVKQIPVPHSVFSKKRRLFFGASAVVEGDSLYVYGCDEASRHSSQNRYLVVARVGIDEIENMEAWRFSFRGRWSRDFARASHLADYMADDVSLLAMPGSGQYMMVYSDCGVSPRIVARTAPTPVGPWSDIEVIHACKEGTVDKRLYSFAAKVHPTLCSDGRLVVSYITSSTNTFQVAMDASLYWPTFVTIGFRDSRPPQSFGSVAEAR